MSKGVTLSGLRIVAQQIKAYVDSKLKSSGQGSSDIQSVSSVKTFSNDYRTITTVYSNGNQLVKTFSKDMNTVTSVLTDSNGNVITTETKVISNKGLTITTDVVHADESAE